MSTIFDYESLAEYHLPRYKEIPDVGLYLEQCAKYINMQLTPLGFPELTTSMISNYVKQKIISGPQKKQYDAEHIACLTWLAITKSVLSIEDARMILDNKRNQYSIPEGYDYFCEIFEGQLKEVFRASSDKKICSQKKKDTPNFPSQGIVHSVVFCVVHKIHLNIQIETLRREIEVAEQSSSKNEKEQKKKSKETPPTEVTIGEQSKENDSVG